MIPTAISISFRHYICDGHYAVPDPGSLHVAGRLFPRACERSGVGCSTDLLRRSPINQIDRPCDKTTREGVTAGLAAYLMWGFLPVYFKLVGSVDPMESTGAPSSLGRAFRRANSPGRRQWPEVKRALTHRSMLGWLSSPRSLLRSTGLIYIWAIQEERIFETSLGYYINP